MTASATHMITLNGKSAAATNASMVFAMSQITPSVTIINTEYVWFSGSRVRCDAANAATCRRNKAIRLSLFGHYQKNDLIHEREKHLLRSTTVVHTTHNTNET